MSRNYATSVSSETVSQISLSHREDQDRLYRAGVACATSCMCVCVYDVVSRTAWDNNFWLQVDYLQLANAALNGSSYFTCLLYIEVWAEMTRFVV